MTVDRRYLASFSQQQEAKKQSKYRIRMIGEIFSYFSLLIYLQKYIRNSKSEPVK